MRVEAEVKINLMTNAKCRNVPIHAHSEAICKLGRSYFWNCVVSLNLGQTTTNLRDTLHDIEAKYLDGQTILFVTQR